MVIGIPILALLVRIARFFGPYRLKRKFSKGMWAFWGINFFALAVIASQFGMQFRNHETLEDRFLLDEVTGDTLHIHMGESFVNKGLFRLDPIYYDHGVLKSKDVNVRIENSDNDKLELVKRVYSNGENRNRAVKRAKEVKADFSVEDNTLSLPAFYTLNRGEKFRGQDVNFIIKVPKGMKIKMNDQMRRHLSWRSFDERFEVPSKIHHYIWEIDNTGMFSSAWNKENNYERILDFNNFERLNIEGNIKVDIIKSDRFNLKLIGKESISKNADVVQQDETLSIIADSGYKKDALNLYIEMPELAYLHLKKTRDVRIEGFEQDTMEIVNNQSSDIRAYINVQDLGVRLDGRHELVIIGSGQNLNLNLKNGAKMDGERFLVNDASIKGSLNRISKLHVKEKLETEVNNPSYIKLYGEPEITYN